LRWNIPLIDNPFVIICTALLLLLMAVVYLLFNVSRLKRINEQQLASIHALQLNAEQQYIHFGEQYQALVHNVRQLQGEQLAHQPKVAALLHDVQQCQLQLSQLNQSFTDHQQQQPEDKLYSRALKLAALGADAQELMQECQLSAAEAEMLLAIHQRKN
jgi:Ca2+/Na+ antiporter